MNEEDEIIQRGLKSHDKKDTICYVGIVLLGILILIPPAFRIIFADSRPKSTIEDIVYLDLSCSHTYFDNEGTIVTTFIEGNFRDNKVMKVSISYSYGNKTEVNLTDPQLTTMLDIGKADIGGVGMSEKKNTITFTMDFLNHPALKKRQEIAKYARSPQAQMNEYKSLQYSCSYESKTVQEDTEKWKKEHPDT